MSYYDILKKPSAPNKEASRIITISKIYKRFNKELKFTDSTISKLSEICNKINLPDYPQLPVFIRELINQANIIHTDHILNKTFVNAMFELYRSPEKYPNADKEQYSMSHLNASDLRTCTQAFTLYMRAKGGCLYYLSTVNGNPVSIRFRLDDIKQYFKKISDPQNGKLFSELFILVKRFIETICEDDWYTTYLYILYRHINNENYNYILLSFPHMMQLKNNTVNSILSSSITQQILGVAPLKLLLHLKKNKLQSLPIIFNFSIMNDFFKNPVCILYNDMPTIYIKEKIIGFNSACIENHLGEKLPDAEREIYDRMYTKLAVFMKKICNNIKRSYIDSKAFFTIKIKYDIIQNKTLFLRTNDKISNDKFSYSTDISYDEINEYPSEELYKLLRNVTRDNCYRLNDLSVAFAMMLTTDNLLKKTIVINCGSCTQSVKYFLERIMTHNDNTVLPPFMLNDNVMDKSYRINELSLSYLKRAATGGMKNLILKIEYELTENDGDYLAEIAKQVNTQMIILQKDERIDIYKQDSYIYLDFSDADIFYFDITDINWLRLYLGVYGLHCLNARNTKDELYEKVRSIFSEQKCMPSDDSIRSVTEQFLREYFVSPEEAANRKRQRLELIYQLRREYKSCADMEKLITERLSAIPFYATYKEDFLKYAEHYIKCTGIGGITAEMIFKQVKADKRFSYGEIKASYTGHKKGYGFQNLSLIKLFEENAAESETPAQNKTVTALNTIVRELDLKEKLKLQ